MRWPPFRSYRLPAGYKHPESAAISKGRARWIRFTILLLDILTIVFVTIASPLVVFVIPAFFSNLASDKAEELRVGMKPRKPEPFVEI